MAKHAAEANVPPQERPIRLFILILVILFRPLAAADTPHTEAAFTLDLLPQLAVVLKQLAVAGITPDLLQLPDVEHGRSYASAGSTSIRQDGHAADGSHHLQAQTGIQDSSTASMPTGEPPTEQQAGQHAKQDMQPQHSSSPLSHGGRRLTQQDFATSVLRPSSLPDLEALMSEDTSALQALMVQQNPAAAAMDSSATSSSSGSGGSSGSGATGLAVNCFSLPIEICVALRRASLHEVRYAYPYVLGYLNVAWDSLLQTLLAAQAAKPGQVVIDAQLALLLCQQTTLIVALLGGLMVVITVDHLLQMVPF